MRHAFQRIGGVALVLGSALAGSARSEQVFTLSQSANVPLTKTAQTGVTSQPLGQFTFAQFDTQSGKRTLTGVQLSFQGEMYNDGSITLIAPNTTITVDLTARNVVLSGLPNGSTLTAPVAISYTQTASSTPTEAISPTNPKVVPIPATYKQSDTVRFNATTPSDLAFFQGTRTFPLSLFASALSTTTISTGNGYSQVNTYAGGTATLSFSYTLPVSPEEFVVPEPGTIGMALLGGVLGITALGRGRRR